MLQEAECRDKGAYCLQLLGRYLSTLVIDVLKCATERQIRARSDIRREALKLHVDQQLGLSLDENEMETNQKEPTTPVNRGGVSFTPQSQSVYFSDTTPFRSNKERIEAVIEATQIPVEERRKVCMYDRIACGLESTKLPKYNQCRVMSPTRRTYRSQLEELGQRVKAHRSQTNSAKGYPPILWSRKLNGELWECGRTEIDDEQYAKECWEQFRADYCQEIGEDLPVPLMARIDAVSSSLHNKKLLEPFSSQEEEEEERLCDIHMSPVDEPPLVAGIDKNSEEENSCENSQPGTISFTQMFRAARPDFPRKAKEKGRKVLTDALSDSDRSKAGGKSCKQ
jgi:hypothetical protein